MTGWAGLLGAVILGLVINECGELSPWLARRIVRWAASIRYPDRAEELEAILESRPGKLFKLITALGFGCAAVAYRIDRHRAGRRRSTWERAYRRTVVTADVLCVVVVVLSTGAVLPAKQVMLGLPVLFMIEAVTVTVALGSLALHGAWSTMTLGQGAEEFRRLGRGLLGSVTVMSLAALTSGLHDARMWVFVVGPAVALVTFPVRYLLRRVLWRARSQGHCLRSVLVAGRMDAVSGLVERTRRAPHLGWRVDAVCTFDGRAGIGAGPADVPVVGRFSDVVERVRRDGYRIVAVAPDTYWTPRRLQQLVDELEDSDAELVVDPALMYYVGSQLHVTGVLGMSLLWVTRPSFTGLRRMVKTTMDKVVAVLLLALLAPVLLTTAIAVKVDSPGPVFFKQRRVGKNGKEFTILKFRSMVADADADADADTHESRSAYDGTSMASWMRRDPRVTSVGRVLRRYSLDELPSLFNVLTGSMSLVGPRPPLPEESATYDLQLRRRLLVKPGLTGLWQVSGRSDLTWEEAMRLDLRYVQDWSLALDVLILWKTFRAVFSGQGAY